MTTINSLESFSVRAQALTPEERARIDPRIRRAMTGWSAQEDYKGKLTPIPDIYPYRYFEVYKKPGDPNPGEAENEIQCYCSVGWEDYDDEIQMAFNIMGYDVAKPDAHVNVEIYKWGALKKNHIRLYRNGKLVTNFMQPFLRFWKRSVDKVTIRLD